jgi:hypothetical protein
MTPFNRLIRIADRTIHEAIGRIGTALPHTSR